MNRLEFITEDEKYRIALGVDVVTSVFVTVYDNTLPDDGIIEDNHILFNISNLGITHCKDSRLTVKQLDVIRSMDRLLKSSRASNNHFFNLSKNHVYQLCREFGLDVSREIKSQIYDALD